MHSEGVGRAAFRGRWPCRIQRPLAVRHSRGRWPCRIQRALAARHSEGVGRAAFKRALAARAPGASRARTCGERRRRSS
eukprot:1719600-Prymnesium_polylepis.1